MKIKVLDPQKYKVVRDRQGGDFGMGVEFNLQMRGDIELHDDSTGKGGVAFKGETLADFIELWEQETGRVGKEYTLAELNDALKECGIEPPYEHEMIVRRAV